jgi:NAD(P)-dependent dehydrogenase (short-subunit alcohol dehydrogenase family)
METREINNQLGILRCGMSLNANEMGGKVCLVTGASAGIGLATAWELSRLGAEVVLVARDQTRGEQARAKVIAKSGNEHVGLLLADLSSLAQVRGLAKEFEEKYSRLDVLVNNAGIIPQMRQISVDGFEMQWAVNHLAVFLLTNLLLPRLKSSDPARVVTVSSMVHSGARIDFEDLQAEKGYSASGVYSMTKLANVLFTYELARRLGDSGVTANCLHPGVINTSLYQNYMGGGSGSASDNELEGGARTSVYLASSPEVEGVSGKYFSRSAERASSEESYHLATAQRLWQVSAEMTGLEITV